MIYLMTGLVMRRRQPLTSMVVWSFIFNLPTNIGCDLQFQVSTFNLIGRQILMLRQKVLDGIANKSGFNIWLKNHQIDSQVRVLRIRSFLKNKEIKWEVIMVGFSWPNDLLILSKCSQMAESLTRIICLAHSLNKFHFYFPNFKPINFTIQ